ncbi:SMODS domain-containing nucleotidyltransferase [Priestia koreensis]|uniref:SMODS domain-containing nucleotidyltransferase n=1 Tax=Priestia koreensis TaxID=284581 RepID=UPI003D039B0A
MNFDYLLKNLRTKNDQIIKYRYEKITKAVNEGFWSSSSQTLNTRYVGSYGRGTCIDGFSDIDILAILPPSLYTNYNNYSYNGQSALIQRLKLVINNVYPTTIKKGDGQVVVVSFSDGVEFEIVPAFRYGEKFIYPDSHQGGTWKQCDPISEIKELNNTNKFYNGKIKILSRLTRAWRTVNDVEISGILIDTLAYKYIVEKYYGEEKYKLDNRFLFCDFLLYIVDEYSNNNSWFIFGSKDVLYKKEVDFSRKIFQGCKDILEAIKYENTEKYKSDSYWFKVFGRYAREVAYK